ncbi:peptidoglycan DD-metalloendopeptidase family protein [Lentibacillus salicampi]|uniref:TrsG protein n=1 Tax=Lentibacillus salicampi TaxID=175306 RepID=A0A4Y9AFE3_9BACI|nr:peptidoglycan DD-metalloendopeptidase family protein [Lentibacillus salicampi]TFJ93111.1 TrsG protein [Lentibacillus salicampi]
MKHIWGAVKAIGKTKAIGWMIGIAAVNIIPILIGLVLMSIMFAIIGALGGSVDEQQSTQNNPSAGYVCSATGEVNQKKWDDIFQNQKRSGALKGHGDDIIRMSEEKGIDPVLFASIALHETAWGESNAIQQKNNPGGLMNPDGSGLYSFSTLKEGLESMSQTLYNRIEVDGLVTIKQLGRVYAPVGAENDPNNLNEHWVPTTKKIAQKLGGLTMHCDTSAQPDMELIGDKSWISSHTKNITSGFGNRSCGGCSSFHGAIDVASNGIRGTPITAFADGEIVISKANGTTFQSSSSNMGTGYGWYVEVKHENGMRTRYGHMMAKGKPVGTKVKAGDVIGKVGSTGASTGAHLHFEVIINGEKVDPMPYVKPFLTGKQ